MILPWAGRPAVNHRWQKRWRAFAPARFCGCRLDCLAKTYFARELASGLAEVIKYGIILDADFFYTGEGIWMRYCVWTAGDGVLYSSLFAS
ncbi:hypothetical protein KCP76_07640 [Salmonella enterica subsp. enterica serovar Weltevreden]|nr:hypothetical protein KCP76_07640 [Salmonella enterica subsp. enterica serovar Weltevreden]